MNPPSKFDSALSYLELRQKIIWLMCKGKSVAEIKKELTIKHAKTIYRYWKLYADENEKALRDKNLK